MRAGLLIVALALSSVLAPAPAVAQDDWTVKRDPFDRGTIRRYKAILARRPHDRGALGRLTNLYKRYRTLDKLVGEYQATLKKDAADHSALVVLARIEEMRGDQDAAADYYSRALEVRPGDARTSLQLAELHKRAGKSADARRVFEDALGRKPDPATEKKLVHELAKLTESSGDIEASERYFKRYFALAPRDVQARLELADALIKHEKFQRAVAILEDAEKRLRSDPARRVEVIARLGSAFEGAGDTDAAVREYRRAMSMTRRGYYIRKELTARIVDIHRRRQELTSLLSHYEKQWPAARRDHFEWDTMARLYEEVGDQEKAVAAYRKATRKAPFELDTHRRLIRLLETTGRDDEALEQYETVIRVAPGEPRFQLELAERYYRRGKRKRALALLRRLERRFGGDPGVHSALADLYARWGEEKLALETHQRLVRIEPGEVNHLVNLGEQYFQRGDKKRAVATWKRIVSRRTPENLARLGRVYAEHDMTTQALDMYSRAIKLEPKEPKLYRGRATVYERKKSWSQAVADWQQVYDLLPDKASARAGKAEARRRIVSLLKRSGRRALSSRIVGWRSSFARGDLDAGRFLVEAYLRQGKTQDAQQALESLIASSKKAGSVDTDAMQELVKVYRIQQRYDRAVKTLLELVEHLPARERDFYNQIAELKTRLNEDEKAIFYAQKALEKSPKDPVAHEQLAERYLEMQQYEKAIVALEKTVALAPRNFRAYFSLARLYRNTHRLDRAADLYRQILKRSTDDEILYKAGRQAINLEELTGTLGELERVISPLAFTFGHKEVYRRIVVELYDRYVPSLVVKTRSGDAETRKKAMAELSRLGTHGLKPLLEALADERDPSQRRIAVSALGYLGNRGAAAPLVHLAKQESSSPQGRPGRPALAPSSLEWDLRIEALVAAGRLADPRTIDDLLELGSHPEVAMREAATFALGMTRDRRALGPLAEGLDDKRPSVQALACIGLAHIGESRVTPKIAAVVADRGRRDSVRGACAYALGVIGDRRAEDTLIEVLGQGNDEAQRLAAWALGRLGSKKAVPALLSAYFGRRARLRDAIAWALPRAAAGERITGEPMAFMDYPTRSGKFDVSRAITELPGPMKIAPVSPALITRHRTGVASALRSAMERHRDLVHRVLAELDADEDGLALGALTGDDKSEDYQQVLAAIGRDIAPSIAPLTEHADPVVRRHAISVLSKIAAPGVEKILAAALGADDLDHRIAAMEAIPPLMRSQPRAAGVLAPLVVERLQARDWREQVAAATAMGHYGRGADRGALITLVEDQDQKAFVRQAAVTALGRLRARSAVPALVRAARDRSRAVQEQSVLALRSIGGARAASALEAIASDPAVSASARALARGKRSPKN